MKRLLIILSITLLCYSNTLTSQSYVGHALDNYAGIHAVSFNPSNVVGSKFKTDINLISGSALVGSDYFGIDISTALKSDDGFDFDEDIKKFPKNDNNFFLNTDVLGPSFMFNLTPKSSIGIITRARAFFNLNNINGELYENLADDFDTDNDFDFDSSNLSGTLHAWAEFGIAYGRILIDKPNHILKGGVTLKYLQGAGSLFISSPGLQGQYTASSETLDTQGTLNYGTTQDFDNDNINFDNLSAGYGADIGFTYEWHSEREDSLRVFQNQYKLKVGVSLNDLGSISYKDSEVTTYDMNNSVSTSDYDDDTEEFLEDNYGSTQTTEKVKVKLPTALNLSVDYRLAKKWFVSAHASLSMTDKESELSNSVLNTVTLAPRLETKWFSFYAPVSFREYGDVAFGGGFRLGPLTVGSGSVFSNLLTDSSKTTDVYLGLKIPIYRK